MIQVYTDGACDTLSRRGGWAALILEDGKRVALKGSAENTTSNRMELTAAIQGLSATPEGVEITAYTDSEYLVGAVTGRWKKLTKNDDLLKKLKELAAQRQVRWEWIRGHQGVSENEEVNRMAEGESRVSPPARGWEAGGVRMVDVSGKPVTLREAEATAVVRMSPETLRRIIAGEVEKGDVLTAARLSGIMAAKRTPELIPLCHPLPVEHIAVDCLPREEGDGVEVRTRVQGEARTGYEMEALVAAAVAALTIYDMTKAYDPAMGIELRLLRKSGGKSGKVELAQRQ